MRLKGGWSQGEVVRLALRTLARDMALEVPDEDQLRQARREAEQEGAGMAEKE
jgi:hypothetical protein